MKMRNKKLENYYIDIIENYFKSIKITLSFRKSKLTLSKT